MNRACAALLTIVACASHPAPVAKKIIASDSVAAANTHDVGLACAPLESDQPKSLIGELPTAAPTLRGPKIDGGEFDLEAGRGQVTLVAFGASWDSATQMENTTLSALVQATGAVVVRVASEDNLESARRSAAPKARYQTVFDSANCGATIGHTTHSWGVDLVPESFLVDRAGNVRLHFTNWRDWSTPAAIACIRALQHDNMPALPARRVEVKPAEDCPDQRVLAQGVIKFDPKFKPKVGTSIVVLVKSQSTGLRAAATRLVFEGKDLTFTITDRMMMITDSEFVVGEQVNVSARYDQDGDAITKQAGDLVGRLQGTIPALGVTVMINETLK
jgi:hypothetical protein